MTINDIDLEDIYAFMEHGNPDKAPAHVAEYLELLDAVRGMHLRIDKYGNSETIIRHLMTANKLSRMKANKIYQEALEYFYCDSHISKKAWRNILACKMEKMLNFVMLTAKDSTDAKRVVEIAKEMGAMLGVHEPDKDELPEELFRQPIKIYTSSAADLGLPAANRTKLKEWIENLPELTEKEKARIKQEADIDNSFTIFPHEQEDPRKS
jgi:hypothetical protein